jgi:hypothetical protein
MTFCASCGTECATCAGQQEEQAAMDREVEIARLNTKRDIEVARIQAGAARDQTEMYTESDEAIAGIEAAAGVEAAEAVAEVLEEILTPEPEPVPDPAPAPVVIDDEPDRTIEPASSAPPPKAKGLWWE